jgi:hypothetical protein
MCKFTSITKILRRMLPHHIDKITKEYSNTIKESNLPKGTFPDITKQKITGKNCMGNTNIK